MAVLRIDNGDNSVWIEPEEGDFELGCCIAAEDTKEKSIEVARTVLTELLGQLP